MSKKSITRMIASVVVGTVLIAPPAFAYIDPGTGSMLLQGLLAGIAGIFVVLKLYWYKIKNFFLRKSPEEEPDNPESVPETQTEKSN